ncbi:MAG TPA: hypothetical protein VF746_13730 [Longimicrobium sp.]|jgi:hypothetical protein
MFATIAMLVAGAAAIFGFIQARSFTRRKLQFVDAAQSPAFPWIIGGAAMLLALPVVALLPIVGGGTALLFGLGVAGGVLAGKQDIVRRRLNP